MMMSSKGSEGRIEKSGYLDIGIVFSIHVYQQICR